MGFEMVFSFALGLATIGSSLVVHLHVVGLVFIVNTFAFVLELMGLLLVFVDLRFINNYCTLALHMLSYKCTLLNIYMSPTQIFKI